MALQDIYIYIYIYIVLFGPVKPELGVIPSGQENPPKAEYLNFPGRDIRNAKQDGNKFIILKSPVFGFFLFL